MHHLHGPTRAVNITHQYDDHELQPALDSTIAWDELHTQLGAGGTFWLTTIDPAGRPHTRPVFAVQTAGYLYVASSRTAAKSPTLHAGGEVSVATSRPAIDIIWSGTSRHVTNPRRLDAVADAYRSTYGWEVTVDDGALIAPYGAPTAGPPPYDVFDITPRAVHAIGTDAPFIGRSTRWSGHTPTDRASAPVG